jgi:hypothetical protein
LCARARRAGALTAAAAALAREQDTDATSCSPVLPPLLRACVSSASLPPPLHTHTHTQISYVPDTLDMNTQVQQRKSSTCCS